MALPSDGAPALEGPDEGDLVCILEVATDGDAPGNPGDTSVTGWQIQALKSAQLAGLSVPKEVAVNLQFGQGVAQLMDGRVRGIVDEHLVGSTLGGEVVDERDALVEKVPAA